MKTFIIIIGLIALVLGVYVLASLIFQLLWNWLIVSIFSLRAITFLESIGIMLLLTIISSFFWGK